MYLSKFIKEFVFLF